MNERMINHYLSMVLEIIQIPKWIIIECAAALNCSNKEGCVAVVVLADSSSSLLSWSDCGDDVEEVALNNTDKVLDDDEAVEDVAVMGEKYMAVLLPLLSSSSRMKYWKEEGDLRRCCSGHLQCVVVVVVCREEIGECALTHIGKKKTRAPSVANITYRGNQRTACQLLFSLL